MSDESRKGECESTIIKNELWIKTQRDYDCLRCASMEQCSTVHLNPVVLLRLVAFLSFAWCCRVSSLPSAPCVSRISLRCPAHSFRTPPRPTQSVAFPARCWRSVLKIRELDHLGIIINDSSPGRSGHRRRGSNGSSGRTAPRSRNNGCGGLRGRT